MEPVGVYVSSVGIWTLRIWYARLAPEGHTHLALSKFKAVQKALEFA